MKTLKLDAVVEYQKLVDFVFGKGVIKINSSTSPTNNIIMNWSDLYNGEKFRAVFFNHIFELKNKLHSKNNTSALHNLIKGIADDKNWGGAYAELVAYNILNNNVINNLEIDVTKEASFSLANKMIKKDGKPRSNTNYDVYIPDFDVCMDIKSFTDTAGIILDNIIKKVLSQPRFIKEQLSILPEYPLVDAEDKYEPHVKDLQDELSSQLDDLLKTDCKTRLYKSTIVDGLSFRISRGRNNSRISEYGPYQRAEVLRDMVIKRYCDKLPIDTPFFLVMVNFSWYNQVDSDAFNFNRELYRSIARRTFLQYKNADVQIKTLNPLYIGDENASDAVKLLTGIIFIDDNSIKENSYNSYIYLNPYAKNKRPTLDLYLEEISRNSQKRDFDNFAHDLY